MVLNINDKKDFDRIVAFWPGHPLIDEVTDIKVFGVTNIMNGEVTEDQLWVMNYILHTFRFQRPDYDDGDMVNIMKGQRFFSGLNDLLVFAEDTPFHHLVVFTMVSIWEYQPNGRPGTLEMMVELAKMIVDNRAKHQDIHLGIYTEYRNIAWEKIDPTVK